jgi:hypothetical protein
MGVATQTAQYMRGAAERRLTIYDPVDRVESSVR